LSIRDTRRDGLYQEAVSSFGSALGRVAKAYEAEPEKQKDLLQDIHLALWQSLERFEGRCSLRTWVYRIAQNVSASHVVAEKRKNAVRWLSLEEVEGLPQVGDPVGVANRQLALDRLTDLIRSLKPADRQIMLLYLEGMDAESIGEVVGLAPGHVRVQVHRIKTVLSRRFHGGVLHE